jgi:hypothetical protein
VWHSVFCLSLTSRPCLPHRQHQLLWRCTKYCSYLELKLPCKLLAQGLQVCCRLRLLLLLLLLRSSGLTGSQRS